MSGPLPTIHAVTDERVARRSPAELDRALTGLARAGDRVAVHARGRTLSGLEHFTLATRLAAHTPLRLFVNDRLDIALAARADGVQLPLDGLPVDAARRLGPGWWIGKSVHSVEQARAARAEGADYLLAGPVYETTTHAGAATLGLDGLRAIADVGCPVIAIGGATPERAAELRRAGACGVAAIRALWDAPDPEAAARAFLEALEPKRT